MLPELIEARASEQNLVRTMPVDGAELREVGESTVRFEGYASITGVPYEVHDMFGSFLETIEPGAFKRTLNRHPDVQFLVNHGGIALARTTSGTMTLREDKTGLHVSADLDARMGPVRDLRIAIERGDMDQMSFAFRVPQGGDSWNEDYNERSIFETVLDRGDVSAVNQGANPHTFAAVRSFAGELGVDVEQLAAAVRSLSTDTPDPEAAALVERVASHLNSLLPGESEPTRPATKDLLALWLAASPA